jgi:hypothetical protein
VFVFIEGITAIVNAYNLELFDGLIPVIGYTKFSPFLPGVLGRPF